MHRLCRDEREYCIKLLFDSDGDEDAQASRPRPRAMTSKLGSRILKDEDLHVLEDSNTTHLI